MTAPNWYHWQDNAVLLLNCYGVKIFRIATSANAVNGQGDGYADRLLTGFSRLEDLPVEVQRYGERAWAVYFGGQLVCVALYLKGANAVQTLIGQLQNELRRARIGEPVMPMAFDPEVDISDGQQAQASA